MENYIDKYNVRGINYAMKDNYSGYITQASVDTHNLDVLAHPGLSPIVHTHDDLSPIVHTHDDRYYTESEINGLLNGLEPYVLPSDVVRDVNYNTFTSVEKTKLGGVETNANNYVLPNNVVTTEDLATFKTALFLEIYPVGKTYISTVSTSPATLFGGTWIQLKDQFLLGAGDTYTAGETGGESYHALTEDEMPAHVHSNPCAITDGGGAGQYRSLFATNSPFWSKSDSNNQTAPKGKGWGHNNMPPYEVVYMWKRTA